DVAVDDVADDPVRVQARAHEVGEAAELEQVGSLVQDERVLGRDADAVLDLAGDARDFRRAAGAGRGRGRGDHRRSSIERALPTSVRAANPQVQRTRTLWERACCDGARSWSGAIESWASSVIRTCSCSSAWSAAPSAKAVWIVRLAEAIPAAVRSWSR